MYGRVIKDWKLGSYTILYEDNTERVEWLQPFSEKVDGFTVKYVQPEYFATRISAGKKRGMVEVCVYGEEIGHIAHIHAYSGKRSTQNPHEGTCIKLLANEYFLHASHTDVLTKWEIKAVIDWLKSTNEDGETNWLMCINEWNSKNPDKKVDIPDKMPDYDYKTIKKI